MSYSPEVRSYKHRGRRVAIRQYSPTGNTRVPPESEFQRVISIVPGVSAGLVYHFEDGTSKGVLAYDDVLVWQE